MAQTGEPKVSYRLENLTKSFPGVLAVDRANLVVHNGEIHGIIGKNGAGKSVTVSMVAGILRPTSGDLRINDHPVAIESYTPGYARELGVSLVPQEPLFAPELSVTDNLFMGTPLRRLLNFVNQRAMHRIVEEIAVRVSVNVDPQQRIGYLPLEDQQLLSFGKALFIHRSRVLLLDEITASLPRKRKELLLQFLHETIRSSPDVSFTLISHHINEVMEFCHRVTVMRDGKVVATLPIEQTSAAELTALVVGAKLYPGAETHQINRMHDDVPESAPQPASGRPNEPILTVRGLYKRRAFEQIDFTLSVGEVIGIAGLDGSGKDEILEALVGLTSIDGGSIILGNRPVRLRSPRHALANGIAYLPKKREEQGVIHNRSVEENALLTVYRKMRTPWQLIDHGRCQGLVREYVQTLNIKTPALATNVDYLSGGNRQKVMLTRIMLAEPRIYVLNEPTRGVDLAVKPEILNIIRNRLTKTSGIIVTSESEEELIAVCDQILILYRGKIQRILTRNAPNFSAPEVYRAIQGL